MALFQIRFGDVLFPKDESSIYSRLCHSSEGSILTKSEVGDAGCRRTNHLLSRIPTGSRGNSYLVTEGDFVVTAPGEVHENWVDSHSGISFRGGYLDASAFRKATEQIAGRDLPIPGCREFFVRDKAVQNQFLAMHLAAERSESQLEQEEALLNFVDLFLSRCATTIRPDARVGYERIRKGKASKPTEFGKLVKFQESENQIISHFEVFAERPSDRQLLVPSIEVHQLRFGRIPAWVAADAGFHSQQNEKTARALGVRWFSVPNQKTKRANVNDFIGSAGFVSWTAVADRIRARSTATSCDNT